MTFEGTLASVIGRSITAACVENTNSEQVICFNAADMLISYVVFRVLNRFGLEHQSAMSISRFIGFGCAYSITVVTLGKFSIMGAFFMSAIGLLAGLEFSHRIDHTLFV